MSGTPSRFTRIVGVAAASIVALGTLAGCAGGPSAPGLQADDSWTVMTYVIADTNLEYFQMSDMEEQGKVGSRPGFNLISFLDRSTEEYEGPVLGLPDWSGGKMLQIQKGSADVIEDLGDTNTGDPAVLADFIARTVKAYPASHYALIINDHGSSWPGVGADGSNDNDQLTLAELDSGISDGLKGGGIDKLDLLGFDACLMATYETASTLQNVADRMVASQELEPGYGWDYTSLETAAQGGTVDEVAAAIIDAYDAQSTSEGEQQVTLAEIDLTKFGPVDDAFNAFAAALTDRVSGIAPTIGRTLAQNLGFGATPDYDFYMTDLAMLAGQVSVDATDVADEADALTKAINDVVVDKIDGQATQGATGLSIYFPPQARAFDDGYTDVDAASGWTTFLKTYYTVGADSGSVPEFSSAQAQSQFANGGFYVGQQVVSDPNQITDAYVRYGVVESDGSVTLVGDEPASIDEQGFVTGFFDTYELWITDAAGTEDHFYSSYSYNDTSGVATIGVPVAYFETPSSDGSQAFLQMTYQPSTGTILSETFYGYDPDAGAFSEVAPADGSTIAPLKPSIGPDGSEQLFLTSDVRVSADTAGIGFEYRALAAGTVVYAEIKVEDSAGNVATSAAAGTLP